MPSWQQILREAQQAHDVLRNAHLAALHQHTGRNVIAYYSGWQQKQATPHIAGIQDGDMTGFMSAIHGMDRKKGLDLILHTPGGEINATESIVNYVLSSFAGDIRAFVPHTAMSAGTIMALACREIWMAEHSSLGPIDPQVGGLSAHGIRDEFKRIQGEISNASTSAGAQAWVPILKQYRPTLLGECDNAIKMTRQIVYSWLKNNMFKGTNNPKKKIQRVLDEFGSRTRSLNHGRHFHIQKVHNAGVNVRKLESDHVLQDLVLSVHHAFVVTFNGTRAIKIIQNHAGAAFVLSPSKID